MMPTAAKVWTRRILMVEVSGKFQEQRIIVIPFVHERSLLRALTLY